MRITLLFALILFVVLSPLHAQITTGSILGTITDSTGAAVPEAQVTATNQQTQFSRSVKSSADGSYRLDFLPIGTYVLRVESAGFNIFEQREIVLTLNAQVRADAVMGAAGTAQSVEVSADLPLLQTSSASLGRTVTNVEVDNLPIVSRNVYELLSLTAGVQASSATTAYGLPAQVVYINGGTDNLVGSVSYYLDGGLNMTLLKNTGNVLPNPDALQEFTVQTNNYNALYGRMSSGLVNVVTKSGTNKLHGSIFYFHRETAFSATPAFSITKPPLHRNQFGATLGGPIWKNRTFFFGSYGGLRETTPTVLNGAFVPTAAQRNGDFSENLPATGTPASCPANTSTVIFVVCDPVTRLPTPGNRLSPARLDPTVQKLLDRIPLPNVTSIDTVTGRMVHGYSGNSSTNNQTDEFLIKVNHLMGPHRFEIAYFNTPGLLNQPAGGNIPWSRQLFNYRQQNANVSDTWTVSPTTVNQIYVNFTRLIGSRLTTPNLGLETFGSTFRTQGIQSLPQLTVTGLFNAAQSIGGPLTGTNFYAVRDVFSTTRGAHNIAFGGETSLNKDALYTLLTNYGSFSFAASTSARTGAALPDFLAGLPNQMEQNSPSLTSDNSWFSGVFLQDDWRALRNLTLNFGLRWDVQTPPTDGYDRQSTFVKGQQSTVYPTAPLGVLVVGDKGVPRGITPLRWHHVSPRVGFAWDPFGTGKTVLRGAGGLFFGSVSGNEWNGTSNYQPFTLRNRYAYITSMTDIYSDRRSFPNGNPFPYYYDPKNPQPFIAPAQVNGIDPQYQWPYTYQANLSVQQQLSNSLAITLSYVFAGNHNAPFGPDVNYPLLATPQNPVNGVTVNTTNNYDARRPLNSGLGIVTSIQSKQRSSYNGFQVNVEKRMSSQLSLNGFYTWSKTLSTVQLNSNGAVIGTVVDFNRLDLEYGSSDTDIRHQANIAVVWKPALASSSPRFARAVVNGWSISAITNLRSGMPFSVTTGVDNNFDGYITDRANQSNTVSIGIGRNSGDARRVAYFNTAAFCSYTVGSTSCPAGTGSLGLDGTTRRNGYVGPGSRVINGAIFRDFPIFEAVKLQLRGEANNVFNLVNLSTPTTNMSSANFGRITSASGVPRQIQLGARILF